MRHPSTVFFEDPDAVELYYTAKTHPEYSTLDEEEVIQEQGSKLKKVSSKAKFIQLKKELMQLKRRNRRDCYTLIPEERARDPFMSTHIAKSKNFKPSMGVLHRDRADLPQSPSVSGGVFKSKHSWAVSRKEFEMRRSLSYLKSIGPADKNTSRNGRVNLSCDFGARLDESLMGSKYSPATSRGKKHRIKLPSITLKTHDAVQQVIMSPEELNEVNESFRSSGPTPGIFSLAALRGGKKGQDFSFRRV